MRLVIMLAAFAALSLVLATNDALAVSPNMPYVMDGTGYIASPDVIKPSTLKLFTDTGAQKGSQITATTKSGAITIQGIEYSHSSSTTSFLREGKFIRFSATAHSSTDQTIEVSALGRLVQESTAGLLYTFTGRITEGGIEHKIVYIVRVSETTITPRPTTQTIEPPNIIRITKGSSTQALLTDYTARTAGASTGYFTPSDLTITPGDSVTFINDDTVNHTLVSGTGLSSTSRLNSGGIQICTERAEIQTGASFSKGNCDFTIDGVINTGVIAPGQSKTVVFENAKFYRLMDTDYPWMNMTIYSFPQTGSQTITNKP